MATDYVTAPLTRTGKIIFGAGAGIYGNYQVKRRISGGCLLCHIAYECRRTSD
jgi:Na+-translocating ferredoxin:NAD+ oxidoreductase RnfD subunit